jgi:hypothetical protein
MYRSLDNLQLTFFYIVALAAFVWLTAIGQPVENLVAYAGMIFLCLLFLEASHRFVNKNFLNLKIHLKNNGFEFLGPFNIMSTPNGAKATIRSDNFCWYSGDRIKCHQPEERIFYHSDVPYRQMSGGGTITYIVAYDTNSEQFGLFKRNQ